MPKKHFLIEIEKSGFIKEDDSADLKEYITNYCDYKSFDTLILTTVMEEYPENTIKQINESIKIIKEEFKHVDIVVIMGSQYLRKEYKQANSNITIENDYVYYVNPFWYCLYYSCIKNPICKLATEYNQNSPKDFLFLIGKPDRIHRLEILYRLYKSNLLENANWKFTVHNDIVKDRCRKLLKQISKDEFNKFINSTQHSLDNVPIEYSIDNSHFSGIPFDYTIFEDSKFQIIAETDFGSSIISEKTYLSILNKRPFIMASQIGHNKQLRQYGFKTFEEYCLHKEYQDEDKDNKLRYNEIIDNINHWVYNIDNFYESIKSDVEYNYNLFLSLAKKEENKIKEICKLHRLEAEPNEIIKGYYID